MSGVLKFHCSSLEDTDKTAANFAKAVKNTGAFVCLHGDIGAGKTAFTKMVCKYLNVKQKVTSPSFVILNEYKSGELPVYHLTYTGLKKKGFLQFLMNFRNIRKEKF